MVVGVGVAEGLVTVVTVVVVAAAVVAVAAVAHPWEDHPDKETGNAPKSKYIVALSLLLHAISITVVITISVLVDYEHPPTLTSPYYIPDF